MEYGISPPEPVHIVLQIYAPQKTDYTHQNTYSRNRYYSDPAFREHKIDMAKASYVRNRDAKKALMGLLSTTDADNSAAAQVQVKVQVKVQEDGHKMPNYQHQRAYSKKMKGNPEHLEKKRAEYRRRCEDPAYVEKMREKARNARQRQRVQTTSK